MIQMKSSELGQFIPQHYHYQMLTDKDRMTAFYNAIQKVVQPHHNVIELGSGTGIFSFLAAKQGANVTSVEYNPSLASASKRFIQDNGMSSQIKILNEDASCWLPSKPADVVICEMLHSGLLREKQVQVITAFSNAHFAKFGTIPIMIPSATILGVQPVMQNFDFFGFHAPVSLFQSPYHKNDDCFSDFNPAAYKIVDYSKIQMELYEGDLSFTPNSPTKVNALRFITKSLLSMDLTSGETIDWHSQHLVLPLYKEQYLEADQTMNVRFIYTPGSSIEKLNNSITFSIETLRTKPKDVITVTA